MDYPFEKAHRPSADLGEVPEMPTLEKNSSTNTVWQRVSAFSSSGAGTEINRMVGDTPEFKK